MIAWRSIVDTSVVWLQAWRRVYPNQQRQRMLLSSLAPPLVALPSRVSTSQRDGVENFRIHQSKLEPHILSYIAG